MDTKKELLLLGQELACIGIAHETARRASEALILQGASASSAEMQQAVQRFRGSMRSGKKWRGNTLKCVDELQLRNVVGNVTRWHG